MEERIDLFSFLERIDFRSILDDLIRQWWVILLVALSASMIHYMIADQSISPRYTSSATLMVSAKSANSTIYTNISTTSSLAEQLTYILKSSVLKNKVANDLDMNSLDATVTASQLSGTNLIFLKVTADSAMNSYLIISSVLDNYTLISDYVLGDMVVQVVSAPTIPSSPSNSTEIISGVQRTFLLSILLMILLVVILSYLRDTVKSEWDCRQKVDAKCLGSIIHEKKTTGLGRRKGETVSMLITNPLRSFRYVETNKLTASKLRSAMERENAKAIVFTSVMENEGKSTVAANMALALTQEGKSVLLMDCDFRKPAQYKIFDHEEESTLNLVEVLKTGKNINRVLTRDEITGVYTIFNNTANYMDALSEIRVLTYILKTCKEKLDYIIIDAPPMALVSDAEALANLCDASVMVVRRDMVLTRDINDAIDTLNRTEGKVLGCVFNDAILDRLYNSNAYGGRYGYGGHYGKK